MKTEGKGEAKTANDNQPERRSENREMEESRIKLQTEQKIDLAL